MRGDITTPKRLGSATANYATLLSPPHCGRLALMSIARLAAKTTGKHERIQNPAALWSRDKTDQERPAHYEMAFHEL